MKYIDTKRPTRYTWCTTDIGGREVLLWWGVLSELNALLDVALESLDASLEELLLLLSHAVKDVNGLLGTVGLDRALSVSCFNTLEN